jgi:nucleotide-binding universal stress UspA family protein
MQHVLVCLDCSELSRQVIPYAVSIARAFSAQVTVLHVLEKPLSDACMPFDCFEWEIKKQEARRYLDTVKAGIGSDDISVNTEIMEGRPAEQINFWINTHNVDLTVLCSHGSNGNSQWSFASTTQKLIAGTSGAMLLIPIKALEKRGNNNKKNSVSFQRILVPLDGSNWAESVLPFAINIANVQHSELLLAHVTPEPGITHFKPLNPEGLALERHIIDYNYNVATHYLSQIESRLKSTTEIAVNTSLINHYGVSHELNKIIDAQAIDLVVMSAHGNSNHIEQYCGKVALDFLEHCKIPVLFLRGQISHKKMSFTPNVLRSESTLRLPEQAAL